MKLAADWRTKVIGFLTASRLGDGWPSRVGGSRTLYGTCYSAMACHYLRCGELSPQDIDAILNCQQSDGRFVGPELEGWTPPPESPHDLEHILLHLLCSAVLPTLGEARVEPRYPLSFAQAYLDPSELRSWLERRDLGDPWLEGNNLLFMGQLLLHLRDVERQPAASEALRVWFDFLDETVDARTGFWGTDQGASELAAMCGGYHQLLLYYSENRPVRSAERIIDIVLSLQHPGGGFGPEGGGACEDVDAVDLLVNLYKRVSYRRAAIRRALRGCVRRILRHQNEDGGWSYRPGQPQIHLGIPMTAASPNVSCAFPTWFRVHTLALAAEVLTDDLKLDHGFAFNSTASMGWHQTWDRADNRLGRGDRAAEWVAGASRFCSTAPGGMMRMARRVKRKVIRNRTRTSVS